MVEVVVVVVGATVVVVVDVVVVCAPNLPNKLKLNGKSKIFHLKHLSEAYACNICLPHSLTFK